MIEAALEAMRRGDFVLLYDFDDREKETDLAVRSDAVTPAHVQRMRKDAGGLICTAVHPKAARRMGLPYAVDVLKETVLVERAGDLAYDRLNHSSFSLWVNHKETFTGITDNDRALTITRIAEEVRRSINGGVADLTAEFRSPGHVPLLRAADGLLDRRQGQTELSIALAVMAKVTPAVTVCEMLDDETGDALSKEDALAYARKHGLCFVEGREILKSWRRSCTSPTKRAR